MESENHEAQVIKIPGPLMRGVEWEQHTRTEKGVGGGGWPAAWGNATESNRSEQKGQ